MNIEHVKILVSAGLSMSTVRPGEEDALVEYLNEPSIYENTLRILHPYTMADAKAWIAEVRRDADADAVKVALGLNVPVPGSRTVPKSVTGWPVRTGGGGS